MPSRTPEGEAHHYFDNADEKKESRVASRNGLKNSQRVEKYAC